MIDELPLNRIPVVTRVVEPGRLSKVYDFIRKEVSNGRQIIVVYPLVEESEKLDLAAAVEAYKELSRIQFNGLELGLLHGKMKSIEKKNMLNKFERNEISILVSTTVIEVGIDIPNATVMLIEHAERFGLSQLHQLRGRVGRSDKQSYCILLYENQLSEIAEKRLNTLKSTNDGFIIAEKDLILRGPGEVLGVRQSGDANFRFVNLILHKDLIENAKSEAEYLYNNFELNSKKLNKPQNMIYLIMLLVIEKL